MDTIASIPKERLSHDPTPEPQQLLHQRVINHDIMEANDENKKQKAPLTPCYPSIKKSLFSLKHASVLGDRKEQLFPQNNAAAGLHQISCSYLLPEPHSATGCSKQYGSVNK